VENRKVRKGEVKYGFLLENTISSLTELPELLEDAFAHGRISSVIGWFSEFADLQQLLDHLLQPSENLEFGLLDGGYKQFACCG
jgi:hypothetical protein